MKAIGTKTAQRTRVIAMIGLVTSLMALIAASRAPSPVSMLRSTFSTTTIASSTTMPIASTNPNNDSALTEKPKAYMTAKVPMIDTGTARSGIIEARQVCRKRMTTNTTRASASSSVWTTALMEPRTKTVGS
jgi:hypothetical protein